MPDYLIRPEIRINPYSVVTHVVDYYGHTFDDIPEGDLDRIDDAVVTTLNSIPFTTWESGDHFYQTVDEITDLVLKRLEQNNE